jgi:GTPase SAR1 family protein
VLKINQKKLYDSHELAWFIVDFVMLALLMINLLWIIFDWFFAADFIQQGIQNNVNWLYVSYLPVHKNFVLYDMAFIVIFLTEFAIRWMRSVYLKTYTRWYFYPFIHWYDLIGCIPVAGARALRFLRVFSILYRLQKHQIIDLTQNSIFKFIQFYYDVVLEELSDRIVVKVLAGTQEELKHGSPLVHRIQNEILLPRQELLVSWFSERLATVSRKGYLPNKEALRAYLSEIVDESMTKNADLRRIRKVPMIGEMVTEALERAVGDIVAEVIHQILSDLASSENHAFIEDIAQVLLGQENGEESSKALQGQVLDVAVEILELMKEQVKVKRWQDSL